MRQINARGRLHIAGWEGRNGKPVLLAYYDGGRVPTIGFGHIKGVRIGQTCTEAQAYAWLDEDLDEAERAVDTLVKVPLGDNQFAALVSFVFNVGVAAFKASTLLRLLNAGRYEAVPAQLLRWVKDKNPRTGKMETVRGLVNRRTADAALWGLDELPGDTRRPSAPPAPTGVLATSTGKAQALALTTGSGAAALQTMQGEDGPLQALQEMLPQLESLALVVDGLQVVFVLATLVSIVWTIWDRRRKVQQEGL